MDKYDEDVKLSELSIKTSFTKLLSTSYSLEKIYSKAKEFNWSREQLLLFLIILRMQSIDINKEYSIAHLADLTIVKNEFNLTMTQIRAILKYAIENNEWLVKTNDNFQLITKLQSIQVAITNYRSSMGVYDTLTQNINSLLNTSEKNEYEKAISVMISMKKEERDLIENEIIHGTRGTLSQILWDVFEINNHYNETNCHKDLLFVAYSELQKYCSNVSIIDIIFHDWTKYLLDLSIGYTWRWIHEKGRRESSKKMVNQWLTMVREGNNKGQLFTCLNKLWNEALHLHYVSEDHHPEFFGEIKNLNRKDMTESGKDESVIDMSARELYNQISYGKERDILKTFKYIQFNTVYLERYNDNDIKRVVEIVLFVLKENLTTSEYTKQERCYMNYLNNKQY